MIGNPLLKGSLTRMASFFLFNFTTFPIKDPTNSFRLFSRELINKVKIESGKGFTLSLKLTEEQVKMLINRRKGKRGKQTKKQQQEKNKVFK